MKKLRKYLLLFVTVLAIMFTAACGSSTTINTELKINDDLSGERDMQMVFSSSTFESYFTGTIEDLNATISEKIPSSMTFDYAESDGTYYYVFRLAFDSPEDYLQKVNDITGTEHNLTLSSPDGLWVNGFYVDEEKKRITFDVVVDFDEEDREGLVKHIIGDVKNALPEYDVRVAVDSDISDQ